MDAHLANGGTPNWGSNWGAGDIMYANLDGEDGVNSGANTLDDHGDLIKIGNTTPPLQLRYHLRCIMERI